MKKELILKAIGSIGKASTKLRNPAAPVAKGVQAGAEGLTPALAADATKERRPGAQ